MGTPPDKEILAPPQSDLAIEIRADGYKQERPIPIGDLAPDLTKDIIIRYNH